MKSVKVVGVKETLQSLAKFGTEAKEMFKGITAATALEVSADAMNKAPVNLGKLKQSISANKVSDYVWSINVNADYGAFVEFGTGARVSVPAELSEIARQYQGVRGGSFQELVDRIEDWCRQKGIDIKAAYVIAVSILKKGIEPQPYLYPAYVKGKRQYETDLKAMLELLKSKYDKI